MHDDAVGQRHRLDLVVGHEDHRGLHALVQLGEFDAGARAQAGVEVGERLVEQEGLGVADDGAADGDALALAAGELAGLAIDQVLELQRLRGSVDAAGDLVLAACGCSAARRTCSGGPSCAGRARSSGTPWRRSRSAGGSSSTRRSPIWISPPSISSRPAIIRSSVDFPQPEGPRKTMNSPDSMVIVTFSITRTLPKCLLTLTSLMSAKTSSPGANSGTGVLLDLPVAVDAIWADNIVNPASKAS